MPSVGWWGLSAPPNTIWFDVVLFGKRSAEFAVASPVLPGHFIAFQPDPNVRPIFPGPNASREPGEGSAPGFAGPRILVVIVILHVIPAFNVPEYIVHYIFIYVNRCKP